MDKAIVGDASAIKNNYKSVGNDIRYGTGLAQTVKQRFNLMNLDNYIGTLDMQSGNTANFNKPLGDGYNIGSLQREGGSTMNFGSGMNTGNKNQILNKSINDDAAAFDQNLNNPAKEKALLTGMMQSQHDQGLRILLI